MPVDLERALTAFADSLEFPGEATLAERVVAELSRAEPAPDHVVVPFWSRPAGRRVLAVAAAAIVLAGLVLVGSPRARRAVADLLGIGGIAIERSTSSTVGSSPESSPAVASTAPPTFPPGPDPAALAAGRPIGLDEGAAQVGVVTPVPAAIGPPAASYLGSPPSTGKLTLVWPPSSSLPPTAIPGVGALLTVFRAEVDEGLFQKLAGGGTTYERVSVDGAPAAWLSGEPHSFLYLAADGSVAEETLRLAGNTLIWTHGPFTYRLESALGRDEALALAESVPTG